ncbi:MAG: anhydro-N-acetylmuramic acid kinase [Sandaracinaceae bacterium]|nr:anhydro-N-acetylmuramic acid kinase [Sandaracinaceae bacterium]
MGYRDELEAARLRIVSLEEELGRLRGGVVQWTPEEVVELRQALHDAPGNLPQVTGAAGPRVLGAIYPA